MLDEYKHIYQENANLIKNWQDLSILDLCNKYVYYKENNNEDMMNSYLSAVICKYWTVISRLFYSQKYKFASEEDVYGWVIDGILNALDHHVWTDPNNKLHNDPNAPDKAIKVCIYSAKINFFVALNYEKRKATKYSYSLDELSETSSDDYYIPYIEPSPYMKLYMYNKIRNYFLDYDYFSAFLLDAIVNVDVFSKDEKTEFIGLSNRKLIKHLRSIDDRYIKVFSDEYELDSEQVRKASEFIQNLSPDRMARNISNLLFLLSKDKELLNYIKS